MEFEVRCVWGGGCGSCENVIDAGNPDSLVELLKTFMEKSCGLDRVEYFDIAHYDENGECDCEYEWSDINLKRCRHLSNVWNKVAQEIQEVCKTCGGI